MVRVAGITPSVYAALLMRVACCPVELRDGMLTRLQDLDACWCLLAVSWIAQETLFVSAGNPRGGQVVHQEARGLQGASELDKIRTCIDA